MDQRKKLLRLGILFGLPVVVLGIIFLVYVFLFTFRLTSTAPSAGSANVLTPYVEFNFNRSVNPEQELQIEGPVREFYGEPYEINDKTIRVYLATLELDTDYELRITSVSQADSDNTINDLTYAFTARNATFEDLPAEQQEYILNEQDDLPDTITDPILKFLPHSSLNFELRPLVTEAFEEEGSLSGRLVLEATLLLTAADVRIDRNAAVAQYSQEVRDYIQSTGLNPEDYEIDYIVAESSLQ